MLLHNCQIGLLIGYNRARALITSDIVTPQDEDHMDKEQISVGVLLELQIRVLKTKKIASAQSSYHCMWSISKHFELWRTWTKTCDFFPSETLSKMFELDFIEHSAGRNQFQVFLHSKNWNSLFRWALRNAIKIP